MAIDYTSLAQTTTRLLTDIPCLTPRNTPTT